MNLASLPVILGSIGALFGVVATALSQRSANMNKRFEMLFAMQGESIQDIKTERDDFRTRLTQSEQQHYKTSLELLECEKARHKTELKVDDLTHTVDELRKLIPNGTSL